MSDSAQHLHEALQEAVDMFDRRTLRADERTGQLDNYTSRVATRYSCAIADLIGLLRPVPETDLLRLAEEAEHARSPDAAALLRFLAGEPTE